MKSSDVHVAKFQEQIECSARRRTHLFLLNWYYTEAPGKNEDEKGKPFVGAADGILSTAMEKAGIARSEVFITNRVKCRPLGNRVPEECEQTHVGRILKGKFKFSLISPKIICSLASI